MPSQSGSSADMSTPNPRRVLLVGADFPPADRVAVHRILRLVNYLPEFGWRPSVLTLNPSTVGVKCDEKLLARVPPGVRVERTGLHRREDTLKRWLGLDRKSQRSAASQASRVGTRAPADDEKVSQLAVGRLADFRRALTELLFAMPDNRMGWLGPGERAGKRLVAEERPDLVYATGPPFTAHVLAARLAHGAGLPLVLDFRDPWTRSPWGPRKAARFNQALLRRMERRVVRQAARVVLNTQRMADDYREYFRDEPGEKFTCVPNGYDPREKLEIDAILSEASPHGEELPELLHPGSLYRRRDPRPILEAIAQLKAEGLPVRFTQVGPCDPAFAAPARARELGIEDLAKFEPPVPHDAILRRMAAATALVIVQPGTALQVPGKLYEMLLFRKPILTLADPGETADLIERYRLGRVACPADPGQIAEAIRQALAASGIDREAREAALARFDGRALTGQIAAVFDSACLSPRR